MLILPWYIFSLILPPQNNIIFVFNFSSEIIKWFYFWSMNFFQIKHRNNKILIFKYIKITWKYHGSEIIGLNHIIVNVNSSNKMCLRSLTLLWCFRYKNIMFVFCILLKLRFTLSFLKVLLNLHIFYSYFLLLVSLFYYILFLIQIIFILDIYFHSFCIQNLRLKSFSLVYNIYTLQGDQFNWDWYF